jgi:Family of unknown function (DUF5677)
MKNRTELKEDRIVKLRSMMVEGSSQDLMDVVDMRIAEFEEKAKELWHLEQLGGASRVLPGLLRATARQLLILKASISLPVEVAAGACRTTFELNLRARMAVADPSQFESLQLEFVGDEQTLWEAFMKLTDPEESSPVRQELEDRLSAIQAIIDRRKLKPVKPFQIRDMAQAADSSFEYESMYRFYCKYVHASAWLVLASDERRESSEFHQILQVMTQFYAFDTFGRICRWYDATKSGAK